VDNGFVMMSINIKCSHTLGIVVSATIAGIRYAVIILLKGTPELGRRAKDVEQIWKLKCMSIMARTNTILKS
jgi:hypothetical protein